jgi:hypothetical protein
MCITANVNSPNLVDRRPRADFLSRSTQRRLRELNAVRAAVEGLLELPQIATDDRQVKQSRAEARRLFEHIERALAIGVSFPAWRLCWPLSGAATLMWEGTIEWPETDEEAPPIVAKLDRLSRGNPPVTSKVCREGALRIDAGAYDFSCTSPGKFGVFRLRGR